MRTKYIFVTGGVISGVGKGISAASIGKILQSRGLEVTAMKIDPYVNVDAGTMNPTEHGEVFVLDDGTECDQDMGNYERFLNRNLSRANYMTTGSIYLDVIQKERSMKYKGKCVEVVPQVPLTILEKIREAAKEAKADVIIVEIGGTVGEYQNILFLEAVRMLKYKEPNDVLLILVSLLPALEAGGTEIKSKPTQYAVRTLNAAGLQPDIIIGRARVPIDEKRKQTIALNCSIDVKDIISAPNVDNLYKIPLNFEDVDLSGQIMKKLGIKPHKHDLDKWQEMAERMQTVTKKVKIGIVGKYFGSGNFVLTDSYISVLEAIRHAAAANRARAEIDWVDAEEIEKNGPKKILKNYDGILVPGGFGSRGIEGKILAIKYARENKIPFLGLCYGLQLATIEFARNVCGLKQANSTEIDAKTSRPVVYIMPEQEKLIEGSNYGGTMRLGAYPCKLTSNTLASRAYNQQPTTNNKVVSRKSSVVSLISERHRHRYEVNNKYRDLLEQKGLVISGASPNDQLIEIIELRNHPFFLATQFHPEFKSRPLKPHPLFLEFIKSSLKSLSTG